MPQWTLLVHSGLLILSTWTSSISPGGVFVVVAECQTHSGAPTPGSAPTCRWTVGWLLRTGCSSLLYTPYCIRCLKNWVPGSCDRSSTLLRTPDLRTCTLWRGEKWEKTIVSKGNTERFKGLFCACMTCLIFSQANADYHSEQLDKQ